MQQITQISLSLITMAPLLIFNVNTSTAQDKNEALGGIISNYGDSSSSNSTNHLILTSGDNGGDGNGGNKNKRLHGNGSRNPIRIQKIQNHLSKINLS